MSNAAQQQNIFLIKGSIQGGKTSYLIELVEVLRKKGISVGGFLAPGSFDSGERSGFKLKNIQTGIEIQMASTKESAGWFKYRRFWFNPDAFIQGMVWIRKFMPDEPQVAVIDEVGPLELEGSGWSEVLEYLLRSSIPVQLWSVRENLIEEVMQHWDIPDSHLIRIDQAEVNQVARNIAETIE